MTILKNQRHELFAQELAKGSSQVEAYAKAGYKPNRQHASRLVTKGDIVLRVAELQAATAQKTEITLESCIREAAEIQRAAFASGQLSAASGALKLKTVLAGLYVEKADNTNRNADPSAISDDKLAEIAAANAVAVIVPTLATTERDENEALN